MQRGTLKNIRLVMPAVIIAILFFVLSRMLGFTKVKMPDNLKDALYNAPLVAIGVIYAYSPLRDLANRKFHQRVNENIRARLVRIAGLADDPNKYEWKRVKNVFYRQIDADPSLGKRSEDIMFNGVIWTSLADLSIISMMFVVFAVILWIAKFDGAAEATAVMGCICIASRLLQILSTSRHVALGNDQLDYMEQFRRDAIIADMASL